MHFCRQLNKQQYATFAIYDKSQLLFFSQEKKEHKFYLSQTNYYYLYFNMYNSFQEPINTSIATE